MPRIVSTTKSYLAKNVNSVGIDKPWSGPKTWSSSVKEERWKGKGQEEGYIAKEEVQLQNKPSILFKPSLFIFFLEKCTVEKSRVGLTGPSCHGTRLPQVVLLMVQVGLLSSNHYVIILPAGWRKEGPSLEEHIPEATPRTFPCIHWTELKHGHTDSQGGWKMESLFQEDMSPIKSCWVLLLKCKGWWILGDSSDSLLRMHKLDICFGDFSNGVVFLFTYFSNILPLQLMFVTVEATSVIAANYIVTKRQTSLRKGDREDFYCLQTGNHKFNERMKIAQKSEIRPQNF